MPGCSTTQQPVSFPVDVFWCVPKYFVTFLIRLPARKKPVPHWPRQEAESVLFIQGVCFSYSFLKYHFIGDPSCTVQPELGGRKGEIRDMCQRDGGNKGHVQTKCVWVMLKPSSVWIWDWFFLQMHPGFSQNDQKPTQGKRQQGIWWFPKIPEGALFPLKIKPLSQVFHSVAWLNYEFLYKADSLCFIYCSAEPVTKGVCEQPCCHPHISSLTPLILPVFFWFSSDSN